MKNNKMIVNMSDYGNIFLLSKFANKLDENGIISYCYSDEKWIDCGNCESRKRSDEELAQIYLGCGSGKMCKTILKGKLFDCPRAAHLYDLGYADNIEYLEIDDKLSKNDIINFYTRKVAHACDYCDFAVKDKVYVEPALQKNGSQFTRSQYTLITRRTYDALIEAKNFWQSENEKAQENNRQLLQNVKELQDWCRQLEEAKEWLNSQYVNYKRMYEEERAE